jgi:hypothetical protein
MAIKAREQGFRDAMEIFGVNVASNVTSNNIERETDQRHKRKPPAKVTSMKTDLLLFLKSLGQRLSVQHGKFQAAAHGWIAVVTLGTLACLWTMH